MVWRFNKLESYIRFVGFWNNNHEYAHHDPVNLPIYGNCQHCQTADFPKKPIHRVKQSVKNWPKIKIFLSFRRKKGLEMMSLRAFWTMPHCPEICSVREVGLVHKLRVDDRHSGGLLNQLLGEKNTFNRINHWIKGEKPMVLRHQTKCGSSHFVSGLISLLIIVRILSQCGPLSYVCWFATPTIFFWSIDYSYICHKPT